MIGWLLVLSFLLGLALTWLYMVRTVSRTVEPLSARSRTYPSGQMDEARDGRERVAARRVEFEDDDS